MKARAYAMRIYVNPLLESEKLSRTFPTRPNSTRQRYITTELAPPIPTKESIIEFCQTPRRKGEMGKHFNMSTFQVWQIVGQLIEDGKIIGTDALNPKNHWQKFVAADTKYNISKDERILEFCQSPKSRNEIAEYFEINLKYVKQYITPFIESGRLKMTKPEFPSSIDQRFVKAEADVLILSEATMIAFCNTPRNRQEIAEYFNLKSHNAEKHILDLVKKSKLKTTIPISPQCWQQRYVDCNIEVRVLSEEALLDFCKSPRTKAEITQYFGISSKGTMGKYLTSFIKSGKLQHTIPDQPTNRFQKFISSH
jgi:DNA-binding CsgD family transcriptional regulator